MAGRSVSAVMVLGFLVVAAFCLQAEAGGSDSSGALANLDALVKVGLNNKLKDIDVWLVVKVGEVLKVKTGGVGELGPVKVKLEVPDLLRVKVFLFGKDGKPLAVKAKVILNLRLLAKVVLGVKEVAIDVVHEVVGEDGKLIKLFVEAKLIAVIELGKGH